MQFIGIIPARYASTRFPGKPLAEIAGKSMVRRVYEQAQKTDKLAHVVVATDNQRIYDHVSEFGYVVITSPDHPSGTDRCFEAAMLMAKEWGIDQEDVIVNIQGDEPFIHPEQIELICSLFNDPSVEIATLIKPVASSDELFNENVVKVVKGFDGKAVYFSRHPVPFLRGVEKELWITRHTFFKHIGMYAYRMKTLEKLIKLKVSALEKAESLEQLRWIENGFPLFTEVTGHESAAIDTPEDLEKLISNLK
ncbi:MAG: 3-deoxy-manno-octulosonate cytidylyltransferase [Bacteroidales bacterium]|nr:3-deoxy-manno-octulosonate cytidylyltransferase [Bacteroidales bacterium]